MNLGESIKKLRKRKGFNQMAFCEQVGITQPYLSQIEKNHKEPSIDVLKKISESLNIPIPILFWFTVTNDDVDDRKKETFETLKPMIDKLIDTIFVINNSNI